MSKNKTFDEIKQDLVKNSKNNGYITYEEIANALKGMDLGSDSFDELYGLFNRNNVAVVSEQNINNEEIKKIDEDLLDDKLSKKINRDSILYMYLKEKIITAIEKWEESDIYAISLFVYDEDDDELRPTLTLGYNTESNVKLNISNASDEQEARWNYAFWLQNIEFYFEMSNLEDIKTWIKEKECNKNYDKIMIKTNEFVDLLVEIVKDIHKLGILKKKFKKEIPILIHELEYYEEIAIQNIKANGKELVKDFVNFCNSEL